VSTSWPSSSSSCRVHLPLLMEGFCTSNNNSRQGHSYTDCADLRNICTNIKSAVNLAGV
jgi:hypothetical protein